MIATISNSHIPHLIFSTENLKAMLAEIAPSNLFHVLFRYTTVVVVRSKTSLFLTLFFVKCPVPFLILLILLVLPISSIFLCCGLLC